MIYAMSTRTGSVIMKKQSNNLEEAIDYFSKVKQLPKNEFLKLFKVHEIR